MLGKKTYSSKHEFQGFGMGVEPAFQHYCFGRCGFSNLITSSLGSMDVARVYGSAEKVSSPVPLCNDSRARCFGEYDAAVVFPPHCPEAIIHAASLNTIENKGLLLWLRSTHNN